MQPALALTHDAPLSPMDPLTLFRNLSHELRQPLSAMESVAYYLEMVLPLGEARAREQIDKLQCLIQQANGTLSDAEHLLDAAPPRKELVDLNEMVSGLLSDLGFHHRVEAELNAAESLPMVALDPGQGRRLLENLFRLAAKLAGAGRKIGVRTAAEAGAATLELTMAARVPGAWDLQAIFDHPEASLGSGHSLVVAGIRRIVDAHGARLEAREQNDTITVTVSFPAV